VVATQVKQDLGLTMKCVNLYKNLGINLGRRCND
jgi:hypothetical protein